MVARKGREVFVQGARIVWTGSVACVTEAEASPG